MGQFTLVSLFSMYPLVLKDNLIEAYVALMVPTAALHYTILPRVCDAEGSGTDRGGGVCRAQSLWSTLHFLPTAATLRAEAQ